MEKRCETCDGPVKDRPNKKARFCSYECYWESIRGEVKVEGREGRMVMAKGHPVAPPSGRAIIARVVLYDKIGPGPHPCHWCGDELNWMPGSGPKPGSILADHLNFDRTDDRPENLVPACLNCNAHRTKRGDRNRIQDGELTVIHGNARTRAVERECVRCGGTFLVAVATAKAGKGIYCSRDCMYRRVRYGEKITSTVQSPKT